MNTNSWIDEAVTKTMLTDYVSKQLDHFFPDGTSFKNEILTICDEALDKMKHSISHVKLKGFTTFHYLHSDLYAQFIYYLSSLSWKNKQNKNLASKLFYLNKTLHGFNCMYDTQLPDIFLFTHPVGSVIGKAEYNNYLVICQNVTIGMHRGQVPVIGENVFMATNSVILGKTVIEGNCSIGAGTFIIDENIGKFKTVSGRSPQLTIREQKRDILKEMYFH